MTENKKLEDILCREFGAESGSKNEDFVRLKTYFTDKEEAFMELIDGNYRESDFLHGISTLIANKDEERLNGMINESPSDEMAWAIGHNSNSYNDLVDLLDFEKSDEVKLFYEKYGSEGFSESLVTQGFQDIGKRAVKLLNESKSGENMLSYLNFLYVSNYADIESQEFKDFIELAEELYSEDHDRADRFFSLLPIDYDFESTELSEIETFINFVTEIENFSDSETYHFLTNPNISSMIKDASSNPYVISDITGILKDDKQRRMIEKLVSNESTRPYVEEMIFPHLSEPFIDILLNSSKVKPKYIKKIPSNITTDEIEQIAYEDGSLKDKIEILERYVQLRELNSNISFPSLSEEWNVEAEKLEAEYNISQPPSKLEIMMEREGIPSLIREKSNIKRLIYENDVETVEYMRELCNNYDAYINLTSPDVVYDAVESLRTNFKGKGIYQHIANNLKNFGMDIRKLAKDDVGIYSDEIALMFEEAFKKQGEIPESFDKLKKHIRDSMYNGDISFRLASRDSDDIDLGNKCGDCTQQGGINEDKVDGWVSDVNTQFLKMYYEGKFVGRLNLVLGESGSNPIMVIDAIEFVPQARENEKYISMAKEAFEKGIEKVKSIADQLGVKRIGANNFSNSSDVPSFLSEIGYSENENYDMRIVRKKPLNRVVGIENDIGYFIQSRSREDYVLTRSRLNAFEHYMNKNYTTQDEESNIVKGYIQKQDFSSAAERIMEKDSKKLHSELNMIFSPELAFSDDKFEREEPFRETSKLIEALKNLYGHNRESSLGYRLIKIR